MLNANERLARTILAALQELTLTIQSLRNEQKLRESEQDRSNHENHMREVVTVLADVRNGLNALVGESHADSEVNRSFYGKSLFVQWCLFFATAAAFGAAAYYAHIARLQKESMNDTLTEIRKQTGSADTSASAAKKAADLSFMQAEGTQAAFIRADVSFRVDNLMFFHAFNVGHVTAVDTTARFSVNLYSWPAKVIEGKSIIRTMPNRQIRVRDFDRPDVGDLYEPFKDIFPAREWASIGDGQHFTSVNWTVDYQNGFGRPLKIEKTDCMVYLFPVKTKSGQQREFGPQMFACESVDEVMRGWIKTRADEMANK